mmetsp:Transcript_1594/g.2706  ORF Transcript_1594/g.2706 Transcript_1594/m.2706 type:complete len:106 (+) Transcript_1594:3493-3810(+)
MLFHVSALQSSHLTHSRDEQIAENRRILMREKFTSRLGLGSYRSLEYQMMFGMLSMPANNKITPIELKVEKYIPMPIPQSLSDDCGVRKAEYNFVSFVSPGGALM